MTSSGPRVHEIREPGSVEELLEPETRALLEARGRPARSGCVDTALRMGGVTVPIHRTEITRWILRHATSTAAP